VQPAKRNYVPVGTLAPRKAIRFLRVPARQTTRATSVRRVPQLLSLSPSEEGEDRCPYALHVFKGSDLISASQVRYQCERAHHPRAGRFLRFDTSPPSVELPLKLDVALLGEALVNRLRKRLYRLHATTVAVPVIHATDVSSIRDGRVSQGVRSESAVARYRKQSHSMRSHRCLLVLAKQVHGQCSPWDETTQTRNSYRTS